MIPIVRKDILFVVIQFLLFAIYFGIEWPFLNFYLPSWLCTVFLIFIGIGLLLVFFGVLNLSDSLSPFPSPKRNSTLISAGVYRYIRHPIYSGIILAMFFYALFLLSLFKLIVLLVLGAVLYFKTNYEEKQLTERFAEYKDYMNTTGRFFPKLKR